ncbi:MAG: hypothetical protein IT267_12060 [Saprospiraceae bacterium]|nr:hypothetical protein [Saprospiraceae bacterium]
MSITKELFLSDNWLDCFCNSHEEILIKYKESHLHVVLFPMRKYFLNIAYSIPFSPFNSVIIHHNSDINKSTKFNTELHLIQLLCTQLKKWDVAQLKFKIDTLDMARVSCKRLVFQLAFTELIEKSKDINSIWEKLRSEARNDIVYARQNSEVVECTNVETIIEEIFKNSAYSASNLNRIKFSQFIDNSIQLGILKAFVCRSHDTIHSISVFIHSKDCIYYSFNYNNREKTMRGSHLSLIWEGIQWALTKNCHFNFDGSSKLEIAKIFKTFGSRTIIYPNTYYIPNPILRNIQKLR